MTLTKTITKMTLGVSTLALTALLNTTALAMDPDTAEVTESLGQVRVSTPVPTDAPALDVAFDDKATTPVIAAAAETTQDDTGEKLVTDILSDEDGVDEVSQGGSDEAIAEEINSDEYTSEEDEVGAKTRVRRVVAAVATGTNEEATGTPEGAVAVAAEETPVETTETVTAPVETEVAVEKKEEVTAAVATEETQG